MKSKAMDPVLATTSKKTFLRVETTDGYLRLRRSARDEKDTRKAIRQ
jgi:hypothetical protein